jgi:hypothetical protein
MKNPFARDDRELAKKAEEKKKLDEQLKKVSDGARHILSSEWGAKYIQDLEETRDMLVKHMINNVNLDPVKDAFAVRAALNKLAVVYDLLEGIKADAR